MAIQSRTSISVLVGFVCLFLLTSSGRIGSEDAGTQLQAATALATTGSLALQAPPSSHAGLWVRAPGGGYYQCHDPGNLLLMLPAAWIGTRLDRRPALESVDSPPVASKVIVSATIALLAAFGAWSLWRVFAAWWAPGPALLAALVGTLCTGYWPYTKAAWDVLGGCVGVAWLLAECSEASAREDLRNLRAFRIGLALGTALLFRYSLGPFLGLSVLLLLLNHRRHLRPGNIAAIVAGTALLVSLDLWYNLVRTGNPLVPATTAAQFSESNGLTGNMLDGMAAQFLSPNKGLFATSPMLLLLVPGISLALRKRHDPDGILRLWWTFLPGFVLYLAMISKMANGTPFGWGPRYLLPMLPILALPALRLLGDPRKVRLAVGFALVGFVANLAPVFANWGRAAEGAPETGIRWTWPIHQLRTWQEFLGGWSRFGVGSGADAFPDLVWTRLGSGSPAAGSIAAAMVLCLSAGAFFSWRSVWRDKKRQISPATPPDTPFQAGVPDPNRSPK